MKNKWTMENIKICAANRDISENHVERLKDLIRDKGYIYAFPIIVDKEGNIIDGQHRYLACKQLGITPVILETSSFDMVPILNSTQLRWGLKDFLKYYAAKGYEDYMIIEQICKKKDLTCNAAIACITGRTLERGGLAKTSQNNNTFKNGTFKLPDKSDKGLAKMERKIDAILNLITQLGLPRTDRLIVAISRLANNPKFSFTTMLDKIELQKARIYRCTTINEYVHMLTNIYNFKNKNKISV